MLIHLVVNIACILPFQLSLFYLVNSIMKHHIRTVELLARFRVQVTSGVVRITSYFQHITDLPVIKITSL